MVLSSTNCIRSLSLEIMLTFLFVFLAMFEYVAIKSSASKPSISTTGKPMALVASLIIENWGINSSGGSDLLALYKS